MLRVFQPSLSRLAWLVNVKTSPIFFKIKRWFSHADSEAQLAPTKFEKDVQEECLGIASVTMFACSDIFRPDSETISIQGYLHGKETTWLGSRKCWLPMNHQNISECLTISFKAILPRTKPLLRQQQRFWTSANSFGWNFLGPANLSEETTNKNRELANSWFACKRVQRFAWAQVSFSQICWKELSKLFQTVPYAAHDSQTLNSRAQSKKRSSFTQKALKHIQQGHWDNNAEQSFISHPMIRVSYDFKLGRRPLTSNGCWLR